jgi:glycosyltransferase involved in cell wall biosynthesis
MNVAIFTDNDFDKVNGVTTTFRAALQSAPAGIHLRVYTAASLPVETDSYLALRSIGVPIPFYTEMQIYLPRFQEFLRRARADRIELVHLTTPGPVGLAALYVAWRLQLPLIGSFHTDLAAYAALLSGSSRLGALMREYMRWPYGRCARVLAPSEHTRQLLISAKSNPDRIDVWPRGVDTTLFSPARRSPPLREKWHVSDRRPALLYVGRVSREKGLLLLPAISDRLYKLGIEHRCIVVGDGPLLPTLRDALPDAVFTGALSRQAVAEAFASADCFVFPSATDTAGNVVLEAQASGLPVVVSGSGGPRENMVAGQTGTVCHRDDPDEWATAVAGALAQSQRSRFSQCARQYALTRTWERAMQPLYRGYRELHGGVVLAESADTVTAAAHRA